MSKISIKKSYLIIFYLNLRSKQINKPSLKIETNQNRKKLKNLEKGKKRKMGFKDSSQLLFKSL